MKYFLLIFSLGLTIACSDFKFKIAQKSSKNENVLDSILKTENFDTLNVYKEPICLLYKGKPLFRFGENISKIDTGFSYRFDDNGKFTDYYGIVIDALSFDDEMSLKQETGTLDGFIFFSREQQNKNRIFAFKGDWYFNMDSTKNALNTALESLTTKLFPCIKGKMDFDSKRKVVIYKTKFDEEFELVSPNENQNKWVMHYLIRLK